MASIYLTKADLKTNAYAEIIDMITREDDDIVDDGIAAAIDFAKSLLNRYDLDKLFGVEPATTPTVTSAQLKKAVKDMAFFNIAGLSNANYNMEVLNTLNDNAIKWLRMIQKSEAMPQGWPERDTTNDSFPEGNQVSGYYNEKNTNRI